MISEYQEPEDVDWSISRRAMDGPAVALVTGCSEGGIGAALCEALLKRGCRVFATARRLESMTQLEALGCCLVQLDVCEEASVADCVETVVAKAGRVDILVRGRERGASRAAILFQREKKLFEGILPCVREE